MRAAQIEYNPHVGLRESNLQAGREGLDHFTVNSEVIPCAK